jgi:hypothetical protein
MNPESYHPSDDPLARSLRRLHPSATPIEPTTLFYQMGFEAGRHAPVQANPGRRTSAFAAVALLAAALSALMIGPAGYRLGRASVDLKQSPPRVLPSPVSSEPVYAQGANHQAGGPPILAAPDQSPSDAVDTIAQQQSPAPPAESKSTPAAPHVPAESIPQPWSQLSMAVADWLAGDSLVHLRTSPTQRWLSPGSAEFASDDVLFSDWRLAAHLPAPAAPGQVATGAQHSTSPPAGLLRAGDWKAVIDSKDLN